MGKCLGPVKITQGETTVSTASVWLSVPGGRRVAAAPPQLLRVLRHGHPACPSVCSAGVLGATDTDVAGPSGLCSEMALGAPVTMQEPDIKFAFPELPPKWKGVLQSWDRLPGRSSAC